MLVLWVLVAPAEAYVDPGAGGMLVQVPIGGLMAGVALFRSGLPRMEFPGFSGQSHPAHGGPS